MAEVQGRFQAGVESILDAGLSHAERLQPGSGFFNLSAGVNRDMAFARGELGARLSDAVTGFAFGQGQADFASGRAEFEAGAGLRVRW